MNIQVSGYDVFLERGALSMAGDIAVAHGKAIIITDTNIPEDAINMLSNQFESPLIYRCQPGEASKSFHTYEDICTTLVNNEFHRDAVVIALGGGVIGDLAGFVAATYLRGIAFINIPTTTLSQIDSSIGGKTAINVGHVKNMVGAFYQPKAVIIDEALLKTLPKREFYSGLVEALKAGLIYDKELYRIFLEDDIKANLQAIIYRALLVKKDVVEKDERETSLRKILNFGHTIGHGFESYFLQDGDNKLLHGEAVALGMLPMIEDKTLQSEVKYIIEKKLMISCDIKFDSKKVLSYIQHDKKAEKDGITLIKVSEAGQAKMVKSSIDSCKQLLEDFYEKQCR